VEGWKLLTSRFHAGYSLSNRLYYATSLMTEDARKETLGIMPVESVNVGMTQSVRNHFESNFSSPRGKNGNFLFRHGFLGGTGHHGLALYWGSCS
jgi:hypothetical protein